MSTATSHRKSAGKPNLALLRARMNRGLSRRELADLAGISEKQVWMIERGRAVSPYPRTLFGLAEALEISVTDLYEVEKQFRRR